jgi:hypothetical protein
VQTRCDATRGVAFAILSLSVSLVTSAAPTAQGQQKALPAITGVWKLNVEASTNPHAGIVSAPTPGAEPDARTQFLGAPAMMGLEATATDFKMLLQPAGGLTYAHKTDNKKQALLTPAGPAEAKVRWDGLRLRREISVRDTLHIVEEYTVSADGKQLVVTVKTDNRTARGAETAAVRRVYDRQ